MHSLAITLLYYYSGANVQHYGGRFQWKRKQCYAYLERLVVISRMMTHSLTSPNWQKYFLRPSANDTQKMQYIIQLFNSFVNISFSLELSLSLYIFHFLYRSLCYCALCELWMPPTSYTVFTDDHHSNMNMGKVNYVDVTFRAGMD